MAIEKFIPIKDESQPEEDPRLNAFSSPCEGNEPYALMVLGDSMLPEFIEGDVIVIYLEVRLGCDFAVTAPKETTGLRLTLCGCCCRSTRPNTSGFCSTMPSGIIVPLSIRSWMRMLAWN